MPYFRAIERDHDRELFPVTFCLLEPLGEPRTRGAKVQTPAWSLGVSSRRAYPVAVLRLARLLVQKQISILHAHLYHPTVIGLVAARLARVKFVFTRHHSDHNIRTGKPWHVWIDSWCARSADHVIAVSEATRKIMIEVEKVPGAQITTVYNGMDVLAEASAEAVTSIRRELDLRPAPIILVVARLHEEKGHRYLFEALPVVIATVGPVQVVLAGEGPHRQELQAAAEACGVGPMVRFLGRVPYIAELLTLSSVVVLPSLAESFGYALVEAMCLGKPIVATACGGIPEVVGENEGAVLVPVADARALGEAIIRVLSDPECAHRLGKAGQHRAKRFSVERMIRGYEEVYRHVLDG
jgi:glycosyltransferase involved in cell wall biosynthesis